MHALPELIPNYGSGLLCNECSQRIGTKNDIFFNNCNWEYYDNNKLLRDRALTRKSQAILALDDNCFITWGYYKYVIYRMNKILDETDSFIIETERNGNCYECGYLKIDYFNNLKWMAIYYALTFVAISFGTAMMITHHNFAQLLFALAAVVANTFSIAFTFNNEYILLRRQKLKSAKIYYRLFGALICTTMFYVCYLIWGS